MTLTEIRFFDKDDNQQMMPRVTLHTTFTNIFGLMQGLNGQSKIQFFVHQE